VRVADGPPQRIGDKGPQHLPGDEAWLVGKHRSSGEKKYYLANLPSTTDLRTLAATIKARWICEQAHQQMKEELGLDHFEGRSWQGLHRHALMTMIAYAFLQHCRVATARRKKKNQRAASSASFARRTNAVKAQEGLSSGEVPHFASLQGWWVKWRHSGDHPNPDKIVQPESALLNSRVISKRRPLTGFLPALTAFEGLGTLVPA